MHISFVSLLDSVWREYTYIYIYLGSYFVVHSTYFLLFVVPALTGLYCCPHNSLSSTSLKYILK